MMAVPTPFATLAANPMDLFLRYFVPIAVVPMGFARFGIPISGQLYSSLVGALLILNVLVRGLVQLI
jgi:hypothetical protein